MTDETLSLGSAPGAVILRITPEGQVFVRSEDGRMVPVKLGQGRGEALRGADPATALAILAAELAERAETPGTP